MVDPGIVEKLLREIVANRDRLLAALADARQEAIFEDLEARALATLSPEDQQILTDNALVGNRQARAQAATIQAELNALQLFYAAVRTVARA